MQSTQQDEGLVVYGKCPKREVDPATEAHIAYDFAYGECEDVSNRYFEFIGVSQITKMTFRKIKD